MQLNLFEKDKLILSLYDYTGQWPAPYIDNGYPTMLWDLKHEGCIIKQFGRLLVEIEDAIDHGYHPYGLITAPPCDNFSVSGARWWQAKDKTKVPDQLFADEFGELWTITELTVMLVELVLELKARYNWKFWVLENPVGRIEKLVPALREYRQMTFNPCDYGDAYTKKTILWGQFNTELPTRKVEPVMYEINGKRGSWMWATLGGKSERTKTLRSATPKGFAQAFYEANK